MDKLILCDGECVSRHAKEDIVEIKENNKSLKVCRWCARDGRY